jgi:transcriptional regulator with XRE-family HTH domain
MRDTRLGDYLLSKRRMADPETAKSPRERPRRRPGLRREEVASMAGVSEDYYARLEQGRQTAASYSVLMGIATALNLNAVERQHLLNLAQADVTPHRQVSTGQSARPALLRMMDALGTTPAIVHGRRSDVLAVNDAFRAVVTDFYAKPAAERNGARWLFLSDDSRIFEDWEEVASVFAGTLRQEMGRRPMDARLASLVNNLNEKSETFRAVWDSCHVNLHLPTRKVIRHPAGEMLEFEVEGVSSPAESDQILYVYMPKGARTAAMVPQLVEGWRSTGPTGAAGPPERTQTRY